MSLTNKIDFAVVFRVVNANPNGDPLNGNRPRTTYEGNGEVSDVCIKRKIRNRLMETGKAIFVQSDDNKLDDHPSLRSRADSVLSGIKAQKEIEKRLVKRGWMCALSVNFSLSRQQVARKEKQKKVRNPVTTKVFPLVFVGL